MWEALDAVPIGRPERHAPAQVRRRHVLVPVRRPAHGSRRGLRARRRRRALLAPAGLQRAAPDRLGLVRPARRERRDQARRRPASSGPTRTSRSRRRRCAATRRASTGRASSRTSDPEYYKWNQWLFLKLYEKGLAYRKESWVNWDPIDQTVLANEQVLPDGTSERSGAVVVKKKLTQWYFKITDYADRLLDDLNQLEGSWPSKVLAMQRNWIGRSIGADVDFEIEGREREGHGLHDAPRHAVRRDLHGRRPRLRPRRRARRGLDAGGAGRVRRVPRAGPEEHRDRAPGCRRARRPASRSSASRSTPSTASASRSGPRTTCSPTTATAPSWPCPHTTSATSTSRASSACRCASWSTRTRPSPARSR